MEFVQIFFRWMFSLIDDIIYGFIPTVYEFLLNLADVQVFSESTIQGFATRIYALLGVIMIFKLTVSMVQYVAQPDKMQSDGKKLVTNIIVSLALMIILPGIVFPVLTQLQNALLSEQVVEQLVLGVGGDNASKTSKEAGGMTMSYLAFSAFFYPEVAACQNNPFVMDSDGNADLSAECKTGLQNRADELGIDSDELEAITNVYVSSYLMKNHKLLIREVKDVFGIDGRGEGATNQTVDLRGTHKGNNFLFHYDYVISTIVGIIILVLLLRFCIDIALRAIKLGFLQLIAPIPIISYADPKTQKNFQSYITEYMSTYLQLFIRLAALYFAIFIISSFDSPGEIYYRSTNESVGFGSLVHLFIIIGALMFASEVPKLLSKLLGIEAGSFSLNPFKGHGLANAVVAGGVAGLAAGATNLATGIITQPGGVHRKLLRGITSAFGGAAGAGRRAVSGGLKNEGFIKNVWGAHQTAMFAKQQREDLSRQGSTFGGRVRADLNRHIGRMNAAQRQQLDFEEEESKLKGRRNNLKLAQEALKRKQDTLQEEKRRETEHLKEYEDIMSKMKSKIADDKRVKSLQQQVDAIVANGNWNQIYEYDSEGKQKAKRGTLAEQLENAEKQAYNNMKTNNSDPNYQLMNSYMGRLRQLQNEYQGTFEDFEKANGEFNKAAMSKAKDDAEKIELTYKEKEEEYAQQSLRYNELDRALSIEEANLNRRKDRREWKVNELDNKSRSVKSPQPESWMPSGHISGAYGPDFGPDVWTDDGGGPGVGPGGPGGPGRP